MKIYLASDHAGFKLKEAVKKKLEEKGFDIEDCGAKELDPQDDYPDYVEIAAKEVSNDPLSIGIIFGKSGAGEAITANKIKGIRSVVGFDDKNVRLSRQHNNANVLSIGSDFISVDKAFLLIEIFINTPFSNEERHIRRINKITEIENNE